MSDEVLMLFLTMIVMIFTLLVMIWQTWLTRIEMRKTAVREIYARYLEINKLEVENPALHKMFMDKKTFEELKNLPEDELRKRALSLFIFDQFAMIYNLGERKSVYLKLNPYIKKLFKEGKILEWWEDFIDRKRSLLDINESYIWGIMTNPEVIKCWKDYKLGETWKGSKYYEYVSNIINNSKWGIDDNYKDDSLQKKENVIAIYNEVAEQYTTTFFNPKTLQAEIFYLEKFLSVVKKGGKIIDVGCGPGIETKFIIGKGFRYEGIDLSQKMIEIAKRNNPTATFRIMDMHELNYSDNEFDGIMALESLIHLPKSEVRTIITDLCRILKPGGVILLALQKGKGEKIISFPFQKEKKCLLTLFTIDEMKNLLSESGFKVVYSTTRKPVPMEYRFDKLVIIAEKK
ncbi:MAG TPA: hypothetical protein DHV62_10375 [Elusimicrobia bacterium]|jgi:2-polyprenyl-3-methyl-5-hydroxy-6-metoxy-1,4-benzoquinol methylase|nr:hypothetical protein [Elusimicrobiota bacterium]